MGVRTLQKTQWVFMAGLLILNLLVSGRMLWNTIHLKDSQWLLIRWVKHEKNLKPGAVPTLFNNNCSPQKKQRRDNNTDRPHWGSSSPAFGCRALQFQKQPMGSYRKRKAARVRIADFLKLQCKCNPQITNVNLLVFLSKSVAEHEGGNRPYSYSQYWTGTSL